MNFHDNDYMKKKLIDVDLRDIGFVNNGDNIFYMNLNNVYFCLIPSYDDTAYMVVEASERYYTSPHERIILSTIKDVYNFIEFLGACRGKHLKLKEINDALNRDLCYKQNKFNDD